MAASWMKTRLPAVPCGGVGCLGKDAAATRSCDTFSNQRLELLAACWILQASSDTLKQRTAAYVRTPRCRIVCPPTRQQDGPEPLS